MDNNKLDLILKKLEKLDNMEKRFDIMEKKFDNLSEDVKDIKNMVNNYIVQDVSKLDKRIEALERKAQ